MSSPRLPEETTWMPSARVAPSLRRMMEPLPCSFSIVATASSMALLLFLGSSMALYSLYWRSVQVASLLLLAGVCGCDREESRQRTPEQAPVASVEKAL